LGDAYWQVGRRDEALFQWKRVLTLDPDPKLKAAVEAKVAAGGLPPAPPPAQVAKQ
ncbi:MAG TPA: tetratricopeptide repeat protein, partial [Phenylobacterium sp.]|nr:tetratricopeptide repeat protein [Phenylobacterium sp.]